MGKVGRELKRRAVERELTRGTTDQQIGKLDELMDHNVLEGGVLKNAIMQKAPDEMDKAIRKFRKKGKEISVATLCAEIYENKQFQNTCSRIGLTVAWFEELAAERMKKAGVCENGS
jgi:hypothetical protein